MVVLCSRFAAEYVFLAVYEIAFKRLICQLECRGNRFQSDEFLFDSFKFQIYFDEYSKISLILKILIFIFLFQFILKLAKLY